MIDAITAELIDMRVEECARIAADLKDLTYNTIVQTATETGWTPSAICTALADKPNA